MANKHGLGIDGGNTRVKAVTFVNGKPVITTFPSARTDGQLSQLVNSRRANGKKNFSNERDYLEQGEYVFKCKGVERFIGNLAIGEDARASTGRGDANRYWSDRMIEYTLTAAGIMLQEEEFELYVVGGLPANTFGKDTRQWFTNNLLGDYTFTLSGKEYHLDGRERHCSIVDVQVLREGAGASIVLAEENGGRQGFIDIGGYSTDLYACDGLKPIGKMCLGDNVGVENIADYINTWYKDEYHIDVDLSTRHRAEILRAIAHPLNFPYPRISVNRSVIPVTTLRSWANQAVELVGKRINELIVTTWKSGEKGQAAVDFDKVSIVGGGAYYLRKQIEQVVSNPTIPEQPELQNVFGYATYGDEQAENARTAA